MRLFLLALLAVGCAHRSSSIPSPIPDERATTTPPFTADQIREAMPEGETLRWVLEAAGEPPMQSLWEVLEADERTVTIRQTTTTEIGEVVGEPKEGRSTWTELRDHALFPLARTTITEGQVELPSGSFPTRIYSVAERAEDGAFHLDHFHFVLSQPGPPVLMVEEIEGVEVFRMTLLSRERVSP